MDIKPKGYGLSVLVAHNILKQFDLSPAEKRKLAKLLKEEASPKAIGQFEWMKDHFKNSLRETAKEKALR